MRVDEIDQAVKFWQSLVQHLVLEHNWSDDPEEKVWAANFSKLNSWHDEEHAKIGDKHTHYDGEPVLVA